MLSRRTLIGKAAAGAAAAVALGATRSSVAAIRAPRTATTAGPTDDHDVAGVPPHTAPSADTLAISPRIDEASAAAAPPPWELLRPLTAGASVARGWRLAELGPVQHGASVVTLVNARGRSYRVHICRNDGTPRGLIYTRRLDLVVMNGGRSDLPTEEGFGQAVARLAHVLAKNERRVATDVLAEFLPHTERMQRFAGAQLR